METESLDIEHGTIFLRHEPLSNFIDKIEYSYVPKNHEKTNERIKVWFSNGELLEYNATEEMYKSFVSSISVGKFWHRNIKDKLQYKRLK